MTELSQRQPGVLGLDPDQLSTCVGCGLCLPHCPTYRVTGEEGLSPRGRIDAMRAVERDGAPVDARFVEFMSTCVQCRGCEPACPSGVPYGALIEDTRASLATAGEVTPRWLRLGLSLLARHRLLLLGSSALAVAQRARLVPRRLGLARLPIRRPPRLTSTGDDVWLFTGCVMDAWQRHTHVATARLIEAVGATYAVPGSGAGCCGALHEHAGLHDGAVALAERVMSSMPGSAPILVNSAGCGAALKHYGALVGTAEAMAFSARVFDVHEWLAPRRDRLPAAPAGVRKPVIVQDPCHLRHVQRAHDAVRRLVELVADPVELDDDGLCCGAGGAYSVTEPDLAATIRERKLGTIARARAATGASILVSANPGCSMHLAAGRAPDAGWEVLHPVDYVAERLGLTARRGR